MRKLIPLLLLLAKSAFAANGTSSPWSHLDSALLCPAAQGDTVGTNSNGLSFSTATIPANATNLMTAQGYGGNTNIVNNLGINEFGVSWTGVAQAGSTTTAFNLFPPLSQSGCNGNGVKYSVYDTYTAGLNGGFSRMDIGCGINFGPTLYDVGTELVVGSNISRSLILGWNNNHTGVAKGSIFIVGETDTGQGALGAVILGHANTNLSGTDNTPVNILELRPPDVSGSAGFFNSHGFAEVGVSSDVSGQHRVYWLQQAILSSNAGASTWVLGHQIQTKQSFSGSTYQGPQISTSIAVDDGNNVSMRNTLTVGTSQTPSGGILIRSTSTTGTTAALDVQNNAGTDLMSVLQNGNVGVGTLTPQTLLDVAGQSQFGSGATKSTMTTTGSINLAAGASLQRNSVNVSTWAVTGNLSGTFTNTTLGPAIAGSTITVTLPAGAPGIVDAFVKCTISNSSLSAVIQTAILANGAFAVEGTTAAKGDVAPQETVATDGTNLSYSWPLTGLSGQINFALSAATSAGTATIDSTNSTCRMKVIARP